MEIRDINGVRVAFLEENGPFISSEGDAVDLLGDLYGQEVDVVAIPTTRLPPEFFELRTRVAGLFIQKLLNYRHRVALVGDITAHVERSTALRDYISESARGRDVIFAQNQAELVSRL